MIKANEAVETFARDCTGRAGRGLIVAAIDGDMAELTFVTLESWLADPLPALADDPGIVADMRGYDPLNQFVLLEAVRAGDEMIIRQFVVDYEITAAAGVASAA